jgi:quercetin dioxygenase-like cupin family protein
MARKRNGNCVHVQPFDRSTATPLARPGCRKVFVSMLANQAGGIIVCLYFETDACIDPHPADQPILFVVIEGSGMVRVGPEMAPVTAGQAVLWPAGLLHEAWTTTTPMTALLIDPLRDGPVRWTFGQA